MLSSEQHDQVWNKIFQIQQMSLAVVKNAKNPFFKSKYADLTQVNEVLIPILNDLKLVIAFLPCAKGLEYIISDTESGQWISSIYPMNIEDKNPQEIGSQITYARRYTLKSLFNLNDIDDDGNAASGKSVVPTAEVPKAIPAPVKSGTAVKPNLVPGTAATEQLKKDYASGELTKYSQITAKYNVSEQVKLQMMAAMPNIDYKS